MSGTTPYSPELSDFGTAPEEQSLLSEKEDARPYATRSKRRSSRILTRIVLLFAVVVGVAGLLATASYSSTASTLFIKPVARDQECPAYAYDAGDWVRKASYPFSISNDVELYAAAGYKRCAFSTEGEWEWFGHQKPRDYAGRVEPLSYEWQPHERCRLRRATTLQKLQALIDGPMVLVGDSLTRQHFFQLSCELGEHVHWTGTEVPEAYQDARHWRFSEQHLVLRPDSPLFTALKLPRGYSLEKPLISYVGLWLPQSFKEIKAALQDKFPYIQEPEAMWYDYELSKPMNASIDYVLDPARGYKTIVFTLGAHYSGAGLHFAKEGSANDLLPIARWSMRTYLVELKSRLRASQQVLVRASVAGLEHPAENKPYVDLGLHPLLEVALPPPEWNWQAMPDLIRILEDETKLLEDSRFIWMGGDRPSRTRPDARHIDGLHTSVGTGVLEAVSQYLWNFVVLR